jgi:hypothetical protein
MSHLVCILRIDFGSRILERAIELLQLTVPLVELDENCHFAAQDLRNDRHRNVVDGSDLITLNLIKGWYLETGDKNNRRAFEARMSANEPRYFESIHIRHVDVEQYGSEFLLQQLLQRFVPGWRGDSSHGERRQDGFVRYESCRLIVHQQN